jgi:hypothetical protein
MFGANGTISVDFRFAYIMFGASNNLLLINLSHKRSGRDSVAVVRASHTGHMADTRWSLGIGPRSRESRTLMLILLLLLTPDPILLWHRIPKWM